MGIDVLCLNGPLAHMHLETKYIEVCLCHPRLDQLRSLYGMALTTTRDLTPTDGKIYWRLQHHVSSSRPFKFSPRKKSPKSFIHQLLFHLLTARYGTSTTLFQIIRESSGTSASRNSSAETSSSGSTDTAEIFERLLRAIVEENVQQQRFRTT